MAERPFVLDRLDHVTILVTDMDRALKFYADVLGCRPTLSSPQYGMEFLSCGFGEIVLVDIDSPQGGWARPPRPGGRNMDHFCVLIGAYNPTRMRRYLMENGVEIVEETSHGPALSFYIRDPFGNQVELRGEPSAP